ncbi:hypothetical protein ACFLX5_02270 [Chloroflexota bacterium]
MTDSLERYYNAATGSFPCLVLKALWPQTGIMETYEVVAFIGADTS